MKNRNLFVSLTVIFALVFLTLVMEKNEAKNLGTNYLQDQDLDLLINSVSPTYDLGKIISLEIDVSNKGKSDVFLRGWDVYSGLVKIFVSREGQDFKEYSHSAWIRGKQPGRNIKPGEILESKATVFWNFKPQVSHLNESAAKRASDGKILTDYAFQEPGSYLIKAVLIVPGPSDIRVESKPISVVINEPVGDDLAIWEKIKENGEIGYFIQQNDIRTPKADERKKLIDEIENLVASHPHGSLAGQINECLASFRLSSIKRKDFLEQLEKRQKPLN